MKDINFTDQDTANVLLAKAIQLATMGHALQRDKNGAPYIFHVLRVGMAGKTAQERIVGVLHDMLEDTPYSYDDMREDFGALIAEAVDTMSRPKGEAYTDFILRVKTNPLATAVKLLDLADNLDPSRGAGLTELLKTRYQNARATLLAPPPPPPSIVKSVTMGAVYSAMHMTDGLVTHKDFNDVLTTWNQGCLELFMELAEFGVIADRLFEASYAKGDGAPGVFDYEVSFEFGAWYADRVLTGDFPTLAEGTAVLYYMSDKFFNQP